MDGKSILQELAVRAKNFHGDYDPFVSMSKESKSFYTEFQGHVDFSGNFDPFVECTGKHKLFYIQLQGLSEHIEVDLDKLRGLSKEQLLKMIFSRVYNFVIALNDDYGIFDKDMLIYDDVFEACFFTTLCMFIHDTKRIKGISLRKFLYENSTMKYNVKGTNNYFDINKEATLDPDDRVKAATARELLKNEETALRKMRHRLLSARTVYNDRLEWSAIRTDSEHEWMFYFTLNVLDDDLRDTFKRIGNLYKDINKAIHSPKNEGYKGRLEDAYKRFLNKLKKTKYQKFLELQGEILSHIRENNQYYGMNIYRLEKELRLYNITNEVKLLLECKDKDEENDVLEKSIIINGLVFPKLYKVFSDLEDLRHTSIYTHAFYSFIDDLISSSRLIIDKFVETGCLGENWKNLFLKTINDMTETVFYDPETIDYSVAPKSQEMFIKVISAPVYAEISRLIDLSHYMQISPSESDDEI